MAEETKNAAVVVPKAMITSYFINAGLAFVVTVTFCFVLVDYDAAVNSPVGQFGSPFIQVFVNATGRFPLPPSALTFTLTSARLIGSIAGGAALIAILTSLQVLGIVNWMASNARQIFAFARDKGLPFGHWIARVDAAGTYPINSIIVVWACVILLNLVTLGSVVAFEAIVSLQILALMSTYLVSMSCIIWRRLFGEPLPSSPWSLGRLALPINIVGFCYCVFLIIFLPWPSSPNPTAAYMNWSCVMFGGIMILALIYYVVWARKVYKGKLSSQHQLSSLKMHSLIALRPDYSLSGPQRVIDFGAYMVDMSIGSRSLPKAVNLARYTNATLYQSCVAIASSHKQGYPTLCACDIILFLLRKWA